MEDKKQKIKDVIDQLKKEASGEVEQDTKPKETAEQVFNSGLLEKFAGQIPSDMTPEEFSKKIAKDIVTELEKEAEEKKEGDVEKEEKKAGVSIPLVVTEPGIDPPDPEDPTLGKTVTTTNEVEKGLVAKDKTNIVSSIIDQLTATRGVGQSVIVDESAQKMMASGAPKMAEVEKEAAEKSAAARTVIESLFEKFAETENDEEKELAMETITKYASAAEDILLENLKEGEFDHTDIEKVADALISRDQALYEEELEKMAAYQNAGTYVANGFLARLDEVGQEQLQKEAETTEAMVEAEDKLKATGQKYTTEDVEKVATFILDKKSGATVADTVIEDLNK